MSDLIDSHGPLSVADTEWLHLLVGDWQVISDLAFADMVLWLPTSDGDFVAIAQCRPSTAATVHHEDIVGRVAPGGFVSTLREAATTQRICRVGEARWTGAYAIREEAIPVVRAGRTLAVIARETHLGASRTPSRLEINYVESADELCAMIARGEFPAPNAATGPRRGAPRVGDGLVRLNSEGEVLYASPNALSAFHRLGVSDEIVGRSLAEVITPLVEDSAPVDESMPLVVMGRAAWRTDIEARGVSLSLRAQPVTEHGTRIGAVLLVRDVSELRRRERELMTKDATIREIHHRVKNNLQTVAALLRLQARRSSSEEASHALADAQKRVAAIAVVHEILSQGFDTSVSFDEVADRLMTMVRDVATTRTKVTMSRIGSFGNIPADVATNLSLVFTEVVQNALEHGLGDRPGHVVVTAGQADGMLSVEVRNDGASLPPDFELASTRSLGLSIVITLVADLHGTFEIEPGPGGEGTTARIEIPLD